MMAVFAFFVMMLVLFVLFERDLPTAHEVRFCHQFGVEHEVERERVLQLGFEQFDVDLPGGGFVAVHDGRGAFAHLDGLHPRSGDIFESEVLRESAYGRGVLLDELNVGAAETEQSNLLGSGSGIGVGHIDRGIGLKRFGEVTACGTTELFGVEFLRVEGFGTTLDLAFLTLHNGHFLDPEVTRFLCRNGYEQAY